MGYPAQEKRLPEELQLLELLLEVPRVAAADIFFCVSKLWQFGQVGSRSVSDQRIILSNV